MADKATLRKNITEILEEADLNTITAKKVRQQLESKLDCDLTDRKKEIDDMVMEILEEKQNDAGSDEEDKKGSKRKTKGSDEEDDYVPKKSKGGKKSEGDSDEEYGKKKKPAPAAKGGKRGGTGYTKLCKLSPELSSVMGEDSMARHEVVKKMWGIIKEKNLYDPKNKQFAICNEELLAVFGVKRFRTFGMMKYLKNHFVD